MEHTLIMMFYCHDSINSTMVNIEVDPYISLSLYMSGRSSYKLYLGHWPRTIIDNRSSLVSTYKTTVTQLCKQKKIRQKITHTKYLVTESCFSQNIKTILLIYGLMRPLICPSFSKHYQIM